MDRRQLLEERLRECNISINQITDSIDKILSGNYEQYVYISQFDGLGNQKSDFDVYVIVEENIKHFTRMLKIQKAKLDIEIWSIDELLENITSDEVSNDIKTLKKIYRIRTAERISADRKGSISEKLEKAIVEIDIEKMIYQFYKTMSNSEYKNAVNMFDSEEFISSMECCRRAVSNLLAAYDAQNNNVVCNMKWAEKVFLKNIGDMQEEYLKTFVYTEINKENIKAVVERMLDFMTTYSTRFVWE